MAAFRHCGCRCWCGRAWRGLRCVAAGHRRPAPAARHPGHAEDRPRARADARPQGGLFSGPCSIVSPARSSPSPSGVGAAPGRRALSRDLLRRRGDGCGPRAARGVRRVAGARTHSRTVPDPRRGGEPVASCHHTEGKVGDNGGLRRYAFDVPAARGPCFRRWSSVSAGCGRRRLCGEACGFAGRAGYRRRPRIVRCGGVGGVHGHPRGTRCPRPLFAPGLAPSARRAGFRRAHE